MGYYSKFTLLDIVKSDEDNFYMPFVDLKKVEQEFRDLFPVNNWDENTKWYDFEPEIEEFSKQYPTVTFKYSRVGEDYEDYCFYWCTNGITDCSEVVFQPEYDFSVTHAAFRDENNKP